MNESVKPTGTPPFLKNYIILSVKNQAIANEINEVDEQGSFIDFMEVLLGVKKKVFAVTEDDRKNIVEEFKKRSAHTGQFIITDTGTGIPEEKRANLFKPFAEVQDLTKGDGLGLPTCSLIAYKLNGNLRVDEEYKKGTRFILELHS